MNQNEQLERIKAIVKNLSDNELDESLLDLAVKITLARVLVYLNEDELNPKFEVIVAEAVRQNIHRIKQAKSETSPEMAISSISDNGQSISYSNEVKRFFTSAGDEELFGSITYILKNHRRVRVIP